MRRHLELSLELSHLELTHLLQMGQAVGKWETAPPIGAANSSFPEIHAMEMHVFCNSQKLKVVCLLEICVCASCCWMLTP